MAFIGQICQLGNPSAFVFNAKMVYRLREQSVTEYTGRRTQCGNYAVMHEPRSTKHIIKGKNEVTKYSYIKWIRSYGSRNIIIAEPSFLMRLAYYFFSYSIYLCCVASLFCQRSLPTREYAFILLCASVGLPWNKIYGISYALMCIFNYIHIFSFARSNRHNRKPLKRVIRWMNAPKRHSPKLVFFFIVVRHFQTSLWTNKNSAWRIRGWEKKADNSKLMDYSLCLWSLELLQVTQICFSFSEYFRNACTFNFHFWLDTAKKARRHSKLDLLLIAFQHILWNFWSSYHTSQLHKLPLQKEKLSTVDAKYKRKMFPL